MAVIYTELIKLVICIVAQGSVCWRTSGERGLTLKEELVHQSKETFGRSFPMLVPAALFVMQQVIAAFPSRAPFPGEEKPPETSQRQSSCHPSLHKPYGRMTHCYRYITRNTAFGTLAAKRLHSKHGKSMTLCVPAYADYGAFASSRARDSFVFMLIRWYLLLSMQVMQDL